MDEPRDLFVCPRGREKLSRRNANEVAAEKRAAPGGTAGRVRGELRCRSLASDCGDLDAFAARKAHGNRNKSGNRKQCVRVEIAVPKNESFVNGDLGQRRPEQGKSAGRERIEAAVLE